MYEDKTISCPYCGIESLTSQMATKSIVYKTGSGFNRQINNVKFNNDYVDVTTMKCGNLACEKSSLWIYYSDANGKPIQKRIVPKSSTQSMPDYIPEHIRQDYEEACLVLEDSPNASAALGRRCLQSMIRDFYNIKKSRLIDEINVIEDKVDVRIYIALKRIRVIGNDGAHPATKGYTSDLEIFPVSGDEAKLLISILELLIDLWYVERYKADQNLIKIDTLQSKRVTIVKNSK